MNSKVLVSILTSSIFQQQRIGLNDEFKETKLIVYCLARKTDEDSFLLVNKEGHYTLGQITNHQCHLQPYGTGHCFFVSPHF